MLSLIAKAAQAACEQSKPVALCGQMSANPIFTPLLIGLGVTSLSVPSLALPEIKHVCRRVTISQCQEIARKVLQMDSALEVTNYLRQELLKIAPERALSGDYVI